MDKKLTTEELEKLEDAEDLIIYEQAMEEFRKNPITYSFDEVMEILQSDD